MWLIWGPSKSLAPWAYQQALKPGTDCLVCCKMRSRPAQSSLTSWGSFSRPKQIILTPCCIPETVESCRPQAFSPETKYIIPDLTTLFHGPSWSIIVLSSRMIGSLKLYDLPCLWAYSRAHAFSIMWPRQRPHLLANQIHAFVQSISFWCSLVGVRSILYQPLGQKRKLV